MKRLLLVIVALTLLLVCPAVYANPIYQLAYHSDVSSNGTFYAGHSINGINANILIGPYYWKMRASIDGGSHWGSFNPTSGTGDTFSTYCLSFNYVPGVDVWYDVAKNDNPDLRYKQAAQIIAQVGQSITWSGGTTTLTEQYCQIALWTIDILANHETTYDLTGAKISGTLLTTTEKDFILWLAGGGLGTYNGTVTLYAYTHSQGQSILISVPGTQTPEPGSLVLLGAGLLGLGLIRNRRSKH